MFYADFQARTKLAMKQKAVRILIKKAGAFSFAIEHFNEPLIYAIMSLI